MSKILEVAQRIIAEDQESAENLILRSVNLITDDELVTLFNESGSPKVCDRSFGRMVDRLKKTDHQISSAVIELFRNGDSELHERFFNKLQMPSSGKWRKIRFDGWTPYPGEAECEKWDAEVGVAINRIDPNLKEIYLEHWEKSVREARNARYEYDSKLLEDFRSDNEERALKAAEAIADSLIADPNQSFFGSIWQEIEEFLRARGKHAIVGEMTVSAHANK